MKFFVIIVELVDIKRHSNLIHFCKRSVKSKLTAEFNQLVLTNYITISLSIGQNKTLIHELVIGCIQMKRPT